jgi:hypothetical protein
MLKDTSAVIEKAIHVGKTLEQMKKEKLLAAWSQKYSNDFVDSDTFIETLYYSLTHQKNTPFVRHN